MLLVRGRMVDPLLILGSTQSRQAESRYYNVIVGLIMTISVISAEEEKG